MDHISSKASAESAPRDGNPAALSWASSPAVRRVMQGNKSRDTLPEIAVRRAVHAMGMRYRVCARPITEIRRTADLVFRRSRVAVFIDGCFWHGCPAHHASPKTNPEYWAQKIEGNRARDMNTTELLMAAGWMVLRFWSHEEPLEVAARIAKVVATNKNVTLTVSEGDRHVTH
jgi:DNA mismatch endonuclease (patch repair protein)